MTSRKTKLILGVAFITVILSIIFSSDIFSTKLVNAGIRLVSTTSPPQAPGWYAGYTYRKKISVDHQKVASTTGANITGFPMLVSVIDPDLKSTTDWGGKVASTTGGDILFTSANGTTLLDYEIEKYASTTGELVAWVEIPFLSSTSTTPIYMYLGNASASNTQNPTGVWDDNYVGVYHLKETITGTGQNVYDSNSVNNLTSQTNNAGWASGDQVSGKFDGSLDFAPSTDLRYLRVANPYAANATKTISFWAKPSVANESAWATGIAGTAGDGGLAFGILQHGTKFGIYNNSTGYTDGSTTISAGTWYYLTYTFNSTGNAYKLYVNGNSTAEVSTSGSETGTRNYFLVGTGYLNWNGVLDEFRISNIIRSTDWMTTEYNNQAFPSQFYSYGGLENYNGRVNSSGNSAPALKVRGGVKFR